MGQTLSSSRRGRIRAGCGAALFVVAAGLVLFVLVDPLCKNQVLTDVASPDGQRHAVVFRRDCGFTHGHSTQVSVLPMWRSGKRQGGNVFVADGAFGPAGGPGGQPRVTVRWLDGRTLEVHYDHRARVLDMPAPLDHDYDVRFVVDST
jgi:hypothetical protein